MKGFLGVTIPICKSLWLHSWPGLVWIWVAKLSTDVLPFRYYIWLQHVGDCAGIKHYVKGQCVCVKELESETQAHTKQKAQDSLDGLPLRP